MIVEYHRPKNLPEALALVQRDHPTTIPIGGGTYVNNHIPTGDIAVVDLQQIGLNRISHAENFLSVGAAVTLSQLCCEKATPAALCEAVRLDATQNIRNVATIAGSVVIGNGKSSLLTLLMAMNAQIIEAPGDQKKEIGDWLALRGGGAKKGTIITSILFPQDVMLRFKYINRTPQDRPIISVGVAIFPSGRIRIAIGGGAGTAPYLAIDGPESPGMSEGISNAYSHYIHNSLPKNYSQKITRILIDRAMAADFLEGQRS